MFYIHWKPLSSSLHTTVSKISPLYLNLLFSRTILQDNPMQEYLHEPPSKILLKNQEKEGGVQTINKQSITVPTAMPHLFLLLSLDHI